MDGSLLGWVVGSFPQEGGWNVLSPPLAWNWRQSILNRNCSGKNRAIVNILSPLQTSSWNSTSSLSEVWKRDPKPTTPHPFFGWASIRFVPCVRHGTPSRDKVVGQILDGWQLTGGRESIPSKKYLFDVLGFLLFSIQIIITNYENYSLAEVSYNNKKGMARHSSRWDLFFSFPTASVGRYLAGPKNVSERGSQRITRVNLSHGSSCRTNPLVDVVTLSNTSHFLRCWGQHRGWLGMGLMEFMRLSERV